METVKISECVRCTFRWIDDDATETCPRCRRKYSTPRGVVVAGVEVEVEEVVLRGVEMGLSDPRVRKGLDKLDFGMRCKCGLLSTVICPKCSE